MTEPTISGCAWKLVPVEPTQEMLDWGSTANNYDDLPQNHLERPEPDHDYDDDLRRNWHAMLAAAPLPPPSDLGERLRAVPAERLRLGKSMRPADKLNLEAADRLDALEGGGEKGSMASQDPDNDLSIMRGGAEDDRLAALKAVEHWASRRCPCGPPDYGPDEPKVCPLCLADVDDPSTWCKAVESIFPAHILTQVRAAIAKATGGR